MMQEPQEVRQRRNARPTEGQLQHSFVSRGPSTMLYALGEMKGSTRDKIKGTRYVAAAT